MKRFRQVFSPGGNAPSSFVTSCIRYISQTIKDFVNEQSVPNFEVTFAPIVATSFRDVSSKISTGLGRSGTI